VSTTRRAKLIIFMIALAGFSLGSYPLWTVQVEVGARGLLKCLIKDRHGPIGAAYQRWNTAVLAFGTLVIPGIIIAIITGVIVVFLTMATRRRETLQMDGMQVSLYTVVKVRGGLGAQCPLFRLRPHWLI